MIKNLTVIVVTYLTDKETIINCLKSIDSNINIKIIENSEKFEFEDEIKSNFHNVEILNTGKNLGYGKGNNYGLNFVNTDYALILNPDVICEKNYFSNLIDNINNIDDFTLLGSQYINNNNSVPAGFFGKFENNNFENSFRENTIKKIEKVDWIKGFSILINMKKFTNKNIFDENYFLFNEEIDLCRSIINKNENIYTCSNLRLNHLGFKSSTGRNEKEIRSINRIKEWHWMWSSYYYYKKNYGTNFALKKMLGKLIKSFVKMIFYSLTFQNKNKEKYLYRFLGILTSMTGKPSSYRGK